MKLNKTVSELMEIIPDAGLVVDARGRVVLANGLLNRMFGYEDSNLTGKPLTMLLPDEVSKSHSQHVGAFFSQGEGRPMGKGMVLLGKHQSGELFPVEIMLSKIELRGRKFAIAFVRDASAFKHTEEKIRRELEQERITALTDHLTGVGNRRAFTRELEQDIAELKQFGWQFAVCFIDLDNFKYVNDHFGHDIGDKALQQIANLIRNGCRGSDFVARIGGDEFATIHPGASLTAAIAVLERIRHSIVEAMSAHGWPITLSMGVCHCHDPAREYSTELILSAADRAMYEGKMQGKNQIRIAHLGAFEAGSAP